METNFWSELADDVIYTSGYQVRWKSTSQKYQCCVKSFFLCFSRVFLTKVYGLITGKENKPWKTRKSNVKLLFGQDRQHQGKSTLYWLLYQQFSRFPSRSSRLTTWLYQISFVTFTEISVTFLLPRKHFIGALQKTWFGVFFFWNFFF